MRLPRCSPEPSPTETAFQFLKSRHFANQVFDSAEAAWAEFTEATDRIRTLGARFWAMPVGGMPVERPAAGNSKRQVFNYDWYHIVSLRLLG